MLVQLGPWVLRGHVALLERAVREGTECWFS